MTNLIQGSSGFGQGGLRLTYASICDRNGTFARTVAFGETLTISLEATANSVIRRPNLGFALNAAAGELIYSISTFNLGVSLADIESGQSCRSSFELQMALRPGEYWLTIIAADIFNAVSGDSGSHHDTHERLATIEVLPNAASRTFEGVGRLSFDILQSSPLHVA